MPPPPTRGTSSHQGTLQDTLGGARGGEVWVQGVGIVLFTKTTLHSHVLARVASFHPVVAACTRAEISTRARGGQRWRERRMLCRFYRRRRRALLAAAGVWVRAVRMIKRRAVAAVATFARPNRLVDCTPRAVAATVHAGVAQRLVGGDAVRGVSGVARGTRRARAPRSHIVLIAALVAVVTRAATAVAHGICAGESGSGGQ